MLAAGLLSAAGTAIGGHGVDTNPGVHLHDDVNRDYRGDIFFRSGTALAYSTELTASSGVYAGDGGPGYHVVAVSDFDGDRSADVLWSNGSHLKLWINNGAGSYTPVSVGNYGGGWEPFAAGDINGDGRSDVFFRGATHLAYWLMDGSRVIGSSYAGDGGPGYRVVAIADFGNRKAYTTNLDEKASVDVLWTNGSDMKLWLGVASTASFESYGIGSYGGGWEPFAVAKAYAATGSNLILFRGGSHVAYWRLKVDWGVSRAPEFTYESHYAGDGGAGFRAIAVSNYDGDDLATDLLWTNGSQLKLWRGSCPDWDWDLGCFKHEFVPQDLGTYGGGWQPLEMLVPPR
jgi:hypothetical protein